MKKITAERRSLFDHEYEQRLRYPDTLAQGPGNVLMGFGSHFGSGTDMENSDRILYLNDAGIPGGQTWRATLRPYVGCLVHAFGDSVNDAWAFMLNHSVVFNILYQTADPDWHKNKDKRLDYEEVWALTGELAMAFNKNMIRTFPNLMALTFHGQQTWYRGSQSLSPELTQQSVYFGHGQRIQMNQLTKKQRKSITDYAVPMLTRVLTACGRWSGPPPVLSAETEDAIWNTPNTPTNVRRMTPAEEFDNARDLLIEKWGADRFVDPSDFDTLKDAMLANGQTAQFLIQSVNARASKAETWDQQLDLFVCGTCSDVSNNVPDLSSMIFCVYAGQCPNGHKGYMTYKVDANGNLVGKPLERGYCPTPGCNAHGQRNNYRHNCNGVNMFCELLTPGPWFNPQGWTTTSAILMVNKYDDITGDFIASFKTPGEVRDDMAKELVIWKAAGNRAPNHVLVNQSRYKLYGRQNKPNVRDLIEGTDKLENGIIVLCRKRYQGVPIELPLDDEDEDQGSDDEDEDLDNEDGDEDRESDGDGEDHDSDGNDGEAVAKAPEIVNILDDSSDESDEEAPAKKVTGKKRALQDIRKKRALQKAKSRKVIDNSSDDDSSDDGF